ncbi:MAG: aldehyde dehydrogenase family protein, partial [Lactobacillus delbrueckii]
MPKQSTTEVEKSVQTEDKIYHNIDILVNKSHESLAQMDDFSQEDVDKLCQVIEKVGEDNARYLAQMAVDETGRGKVEDKVTKNTYAAQTIWESMKDMKTVGVIEEDKQEGLMKIAEPIGAIAGVTPVTNPTSTVIFKAMIAMKSKNTIIFGFHPQAQKCCVETAKLIKEATVAAGAPENWIQWI